MNEEWSDVVSRADLVEMYDHEITDDQWDRIVEALDDAVANALAEYM